MSEFSSVHVPVASLTVYRNLLSNETVSRFLRLLAAAEGGDAASFYAEYGAFFKDLSDEDAELDISALLERLIRYDDNAFSRAAAGRREGGAYGLLRKAAEHDLAALSRLAAITAGQLKAAAGGAADEETAALPAYAANSKGGFFARASLELVDEAERFYR